MAGQGDRSSGLVLGLTMAETAILIIFVLLLALTALLGREAERRRSAEDELEQLEEIRLVLEESNLQPKAAVDLLRARGTERQDADNWRDLVRGLAEEPPPSPTHIAKRLREARKRDADHRTIDESLRAAGVEPTSETLRALAAIVAAAHEANVTSDEAARVFGIYRALEDALGRLGDRMTPDAVAAMSRDAARWREEGGGGRGTDHPSCWYDADRTVAYLFDVALTNDGFVIQPAHAPQHEEARAALPLDSVRTGTILTAQQFLGQTRPVFSHSLERDCRFFVRAFDLTSADRKELYKERMRTLESRFYKNANPSGPPPSVDPAPLRP